MQSQTIANHKSSLLYRWQRVYSEWFLGYSLVAPALIIIFGLVAYPFVVAISLSMSNAQVGIPGKFIGFENYRYLLNFDAFQHAFRNSFVFTFSSVALKTVLGLTLAQLLNKNFYGKKIIRGCILLPWVVPTALSTLGWLWMYDPLYSVFNWALKNMGLIDDNLSWLGDPTLAMIAVISVNVWRGLPFFAISMLAGLVGIPQEMYEAAEVDGAGAIGKFLHITIPMLKPVLAIVILFSTIMTFSDFPIVYVLTGGGPMNSTQVFATLTHTIGLMGSDLGKGAATSLYMFPVLVVVVLLMLRLLKRED